MKKRMLFAVLLVLALVLAGCGETDYYLVSEYSWTMATAQRLSNGTFAAYAPGTEGVDTTKGPYEGAEEISLTLTAVKTEIPEDAKTGEFEIRIDEGVFTLENTDTGEKWEGTYNMANAISDASYYDIFIGDTVGAATLKILENDDKTQTQLLMLEIGGYNIRLVGSVGSADSQ